MDGIVRLNMQLNDLIIITFDFMFLGGSFVVNKNSTFEGGYFKSAQGVVFFKFESRNEKTHYPLTLKFEN